LCRIRGGGAQVHRCTSADADADADNIQQRLLLRRLWVVQSWCRGGGLVVVQSRCRGAAKVQMQRCKGAELQRFRIQQRMCRQGAKVVCRGAEVLKRRLCR
jgi:hypothetical protein